MASTLDMTLDDIIKTNKKKPSSNGGGAGAGPKRRTRPAAAAGGPARRNFKRAGKRALPISKAPDAAWQHDLFNDEHPAKMARISSIETGTKLYISNLDYGVSNDDVKELFSELGDLKRYSVHYDRSGRSKGTAEVVYARRADALAAVKRYNNVQLDGKPMKIEIVGTNVSAPAAPAALPKIAGFGGAPKSGQRRGPSAPAKRGSGGRGGMRRRGQGRRNGPPKKAVSAEDLDKDLDNYHNEAMQTN
ncbi:THO complex subunit 4 [Rhynchospora pubera]|uniref:THO complex subunit 4 n=1 Tax=Rhynchospora pubera TaxID=906938 RepID=A0AAV8FJ02_9POAL|nr:THO complex subunit 4 [Rhynchospora pubera]